MPCFSDFIFSLLNWGFHFQTLINMSLKSARGKIQSVSELSEDTDSESRRFQFDQGTLTKVSQSTMYSW